MSNNSDSITRIPHINIRHPLYSVIANLPRLNPMPDIPINNPLYNPLLDTNSNFNNFSLFKPTALGFLYLLAGITAA